MVADPQHLDPVDVQRSLLALGMPVTESDANRVLAVLSDSGDTAAHSVDADGFVTAVRRLVAEDDVRAASRDLHAPPVQPPYGTQDVEAEVRQRVCGPQ